MPRQSRAPLALLVAALFCTQGEARASITCVPAQTCGEQIAAPYLGVAPFSNSPYQASYTDCASPGNFGERYQCTEFVKRFYSVALNTTNALAWRGAALSYYTDANTKGLVAFPNHTSATPPQPNDVLVFDAYAKDTVGHVAIVTSVANGTVSVIEQNFACNGIATMSLTSANGLWSVGPRSDGQPVKGWARLPGASGGTNFAPRFDIVTIGKPVGLAVADFDNDGHQDIAATIYNEGPGNQVVVYHNTSAPGALSFDSQPVTLTTDTGPEGIVAVDLDGDGKVDLAVANAGGGTVTIFRNVSTPGSIAFTLAARIFVPSTPHRIAVADFDGDGKVDLIVTSNSAEAVTVLHNASSQGNISFDSQTTFSTQSFPNQLAVADIDGDGRPDILVPLTNPSTLAVYLNTSTPGHVSAAAPQYFPTGASPEGIAVADLNGDGKLDVLVPAGGANTLGVFTNASSPGTLSLSRQDLATGAQPDAVAVADIEGTSRPDVVVLNGGDNSVTVFHNGSTGGTVSLTSVTTAATSLSPISLAIADIDGDGKLDIVTTNEISGSISVLLNLGGQH